MSADPQHRMDQAGSTRDTESLPKQAASLDPDTNRQTNGAPAGHRPDIRAQNPLSRRWIALLVLAALLSLALAGCRNGAAEEGDAEEEAPPIPVEVQQADRGEVFAIYSGTAPLEAEAEANVIAKVGGEVRAILVEEGDRVEAGAVLARLDGDRLRLEVQRTRANLAKLERDYERNSQLQKKGLLSAESVEQLRFDLDAQRAQLELAQLELSYTQIRAPISGVISTRHIKIGNTIPPDTVAFHISDMDPLLAYLHVPERQFNKLQPGQETEIRLDALGGRRFPGRILRISPVVDADTGTFKVTIEASDKTGLLKPGMFGRISIVYERHVDAVLVPRVAIVDDESEPVVFVVQGDVVQRRPVRTGLANGDRIEIVDGLEAAESVVVVGQNALRDGGKVRVVTAQPEPAPVVDSLAGG